VSHKGGASDLVFKAIEDLVARVQKKPTIMSENMIWVLKELSEAWTMTAREIKVRMYGEGYRFSDSTTERTLKELIKKGLARRPRHGVYQASFKLIFIQALENTGYVELSRELKNQGVSIK